MRIHIAVLLCILTALLFPARVRAQCWAAFSPDGRMLATTNRDHLIQWQRLPK